MTMDFERGTAPGTPDPVPIDGPQILDRIARLEAAVQANRFEKKMMRAAGIVAAGLMLLAAVVQVRSAHLEVRENGGANPQSSNELRLVGTDGSGADRAIRIHNQSIDGANYRLAVLEQGGTERLTLHHEGRLGIGNSGPASALHVDSNAAADTAIVTLENSVADAKVFVTSADPESSVSGSPGDLVVDTANGALYLKATGAATTTGWSRIGGRHPFFAYDATGGQALGATAITVNLDTLGIGDAAYYTLASDEITFLVTGTYRVDVEVGYYSTNSGAQDGSTQASVEEDTGSGYALIPYAIDGMDHLKNGITFTHSQSWIRTFSAGSKIRVRCVRDAQNSGMTTLANMSRVLIERVD